MSLLREIQEAAIDAKLPLATLLRKCKVLGARLGNADFKGWVENELNGYKSKDDLPEYRVLRVNSKGHFYGTFQSSLSNADIPLSCIPEKLRVSLDHCYMMEPVAALEALVAVANSDGGTEAKEPWNPDLVAYVSQRIYEGMNCMQAWKVIPITRVVAALDSVRNRVLNFALEIEAAAPDAGEAPINSSPLPQEMVQQIFITNITGDVQNVAAGSTNVRQHAAITEHNAELFDALLSALSKAQADASVVGRLSGVVEEMRRTQGSDGFKAQYQIFMAGLADHIQVFGPLVLPYLPALAALLP